MIWLLLGVALLGCAAAAAALRLGPSGAARRQATSDLVAAATAWAAGVDADLARSSDDLLVVPRDVRSEWEATRPSGRLPARVQRAWARAAWAVRYAGVAPSDVLLLAFNRAAAEELQERVDARFRAAGIDPTGVRASTFHAFGLAVIGRATGRKPRLAEQCRLPVRAPVRA